MAYLQATLYLCERCGEKLKGQLSLGAQVTRSFTSEIRGLAHLYGRFEEELQQIGSEALTIWAIYWMLEVSCASGLGVNGSK